MPGLKDSRLASFWRSLLWLAVLDLLVMGVAGAMWLGLGLIDVWAGALTSLLRVASWVWYLRSLSASVSAWEARADTCGDDQLIEADRALRRLPHRFALGYGLGWLTCGLLGVVLQSVAQGEIVRGSAELLGATSWALGVVIAASALTRPLFDALSIDSKLELDETLRGRGLSPRRPRGSLADKLSGVAVLAVCVAVAMGGLLTLEHAHSVRDAAVAEQRHRVELSAASLAAGWAETPAGVEVVEAGHLPETLALASGAAPEVVTSYDRQRGRAFAAAPAADGRWVVGSAAVEDKIGSSVAFLLLVSGLTALIAWLVARADGRSLSSSIERFSAATQLFTEGGELQALEQVVALDNDELGRLATSFADLHDLLVQLAEAAGSVAGGDLSVEIHGSGELDRAFRAMLTQLHGVIERITGSSRELASLAAQIQLLAQRQDQAAQRQVARVREVSTTVATLSEATEDITIAAIDVLTNAEQTVEETDSMAESVAQLGLHATSVGVLLEIIRDIADRSDLLALNGALEATRAGEAGHGFALVAAEMRRLAERVTGTVDDVGERVASIKASGANAVTVTVRSRERIRTTAEAAQDISRVMQDQSVAMEQASIGVLALVDGASEATTAASQTRAAVAGLCARVAELEQLVAAFEVRVQAPVTE